MVFAGLKEQRSKGTQIFAGRPAWSAQLSRRAAQGSKLWGLRGLAHLHKVLKSPEDPRPVSGWLSIVTSLQHKRTEYREASEPTWQPVLDCQVKMPHGGLSQDGSSKTEGREGRGEGNEGSSCTCTI